MGDVGVEEELDLIGVPHFGGPKVTRIRCFRAAVVLLLCCCHADALLLSCCCQAVVTFESSLSLPCSYLIVDAFIRGLTVRIPLLVLFVISKVGVMELRQALGG